MAKLEAQTSELAESPVDYGGVDRSSRKRSGKLYGITYHTTGSSLPKKAGWDGDQALRDAVDYYTRKSKWAGPHYVIGWDGTVVRTTASEDMAGAHAGITDDDDTDLTRAQIVNLYKNGGWEKYVSPRGAELWHARWSKASSPVDLVPNGNLYGVNDFWLGVEMIPITDGGELHAAPAYKGSRFTTAQHDAARDLALDIAARHDWPDNWQSQTVSRLTGHSDLNPIQRDSKGFPLWDPGYHTGAFDLDYVRDVDTVPTKRVISTPTPTPTMPTTDDPTPVTPTADREPYRLPEVVVTAPKPETEGTSPWILLLLFLLLGD